MNKYKVKISHVFSEVIDVEALNEEGAKERVIELLKKEDREVKTTYETTIPAEHWPIITEDKYNEMVKEFETKLAKQEEVNKEEPNIIIPSVLES
jgi:hypothetical protein